MAMTSTRNNRKQTMKIKCPACNSYTPPVKVPTIHNGQEVRVKCIKCQATIVLKLKVEKK